MTTFFFVLQRTSNETTCRWPLIFVRRIFILRRGVAWTFPQEIPHRLSSRYILSLSPYLLCSLAMFLLQRFCVARFEQLFVVNKLNAWTRVDCLCPFTRNHNNNTKYHNWCHRSSLQQQKTCHSERERAARQKGKKCATTRHSILWHLPHNTQDTTMNISCFSECCSICWATTTTHSYNRIFSSLFIYIRYTRVATALFASSKLWTILCTLYGVCSFVQAQARGLTMSTMWQNWRMRSADVLCI